MVFRILENAFMKHSDTKDDIIINPQCKIAPYKFVQNVFSPICHENIFLENGLRIL